MSIKLNDLLNFTKEEIRNVKVKFNICDGVDDPMDLFLANPEEVNTNWLFWNNNQKYFQVGQIAICLVKLGDDKWLLTTIKKITKDLNRRNKVSFEGEELLKYKKYFGRVIIKYHKSFQSMRRYFDGICNDLIVNQILPDTFDGEDFPGYDNVKLTYNQLATIVGNNKKDWVAALGSQKAVYLITDIKNGKLYVGSATSNKGMLLQRWADYVDNGHGGNVELKKLVKRKGLEYVKKNFQYSILENFNSKVDDEIILRRESWWKEVLCSRQFGYNSN